ncbi:NADPH:quinone oxidoreductase family protein [Nannocystaceae bacterium ST9]
MQPTGQRVVIQAFGETPLDAIEHHLAFEDQPPPDPSTLGPRDVLIAVESCAVGWVDLLMTSGQYQHMASPPYTPGLEYAGRVIAIGSEVTSPKLGARVLADGLLTGPRSLGPYQRWGGFASYAVAPAEAALPLPDDWSFDEGCNLLGNYETAYHCLITRGRLQAGETVLILGASGSTGLAAVHIAKLIGATVIAVGRSPAKLEQVRAQGADHVVVGEGGFKDAIKTLTGGRGVDVIYDGVGGESSIEAIACAGFGARFLVVGWAATPFVARGKGQRGAPNVNMLPTNLILMKSLDVLGCPTAISTHRDPSLRAPRLEQILAWVAAGRLRPHVAEVYPLREVRAAMLAKWESRTVGGIVVHPGA